MKNKTNINGTTTQDDIVIAKLTIKKSSKLTDEAVKQIVDWLKMHAEDLEKLRSQYANNFTGTFFGKDSFYIE